MLAGLGPASLSALSLGIALALTGLAFRQVTIMDRHEPIELLSWTAVGVLLIACVTVLASKRLELGPIDLVPSANSSPATDLGNAIVGGLVVAVVVLAVGIAGSRIAGIRADRARRLDDINQAQLLLALAPSLAHVDLSGRDLSWMVLRKKDMRGLRARRCCFFRANLEGATLTGAELQDSDLTNCYLDQADLTGAWLDGATAKGARLSRANLDGARLFAVNLKDADLNGGTFQGAHFNDTTVWPIGFKPDSFGAHRCDSRMTRPPEPPRQGCPGAVGSSTLLKAPHLERTSEQDDRALQETSREQLLVESLVYKRNDHRNQENS